jgi:hypothetical protein
MSTGSTSADSAFPFATFWSSYLEQADVQSKAMLECLQELGDPKQFQRRWLDAMSRSFDSYMRTPAFLEAMQRHMKLMTDMKAAQDMVFQDVARHAGIPLASDIFGLFERLHSVEQTILNRLKAIEERLGAIETQLSAGRNTH